MALLVLDAEGVPRPGHGGSTKASALTVDSLHQVGAGHHAATRPEPVVAAAPALDQLAQGFRVTRPIKGATPAAARKSPKPSMCRGWTVDTSRAGRRRFCMPEIRGNGVNVADHRVRLRDGDA